MKQVNLQAPGGLETKEGYLLQSTETLRPSINVRSDVLIHAFEFTSKADLVVALFRVRCEVEVMDVARQPGAKAQMEDRLQVPDLNI